MRARSALTGSGVLITLLTLSMFINYIDRSNLSVAAPLLKQQLHLGNEQIGWLSSAFFWSYALLQLTGISGWIADNYPVGRVFAFGFAVWSLATIGTGLLSGFAAIFAMRLVLGAGESLAYPCYSRMIAMDIPQDRRGRANALLDAGSKLGPALGTLLGGLLLMRTGWRGFFIATGVAGLLWLLPWLRWMPKRGASRMDWEPGDYSIGQLLTKRSAWGSFLGHFFGNYYWFFLLLWLPTFLVQERGLSLAGMARAGSLAYLVIATGTLAAGTLSDLLLRRGLDVTTVRKSVVVAGLVGSAVIVLVPAVTGLRSTMVVLLVACLCFGAYTSNHWAVTQTLAGPVMAGRWTSLQNGVGNLAGIAASWFTGHAVQAGGSFRLSFLVTGGSALLAAVLWGVVVGPVQPVSWRSNGQLPGRA